MHLFFIKFRYKIYFLFIFLLGTNFWHSLYAQDSAKPNEVAEEIWSTIGIQIEQGEKDSLELMLTEVRKSCGNQHDCISHAYIKLMHKFEDEKFDLPSAIYVCNVMLEFAQKHKNKGIIGYGYSNLSRYHDALGNKKETTIYIDKALPIHEELGDYHKVVRLKMWKLERLLRETQLEDVLPKIDLLLEEIKKYKDPKLEFNTVLSVIETKLLLGLNSDVEEHLKYQEILLSKVHGDSVPQDVSLEVDRYKGQLFLQKRDTANARIYYAKALDYSLKIPSIWREIFVRQKLVEIEWHLGNYDLAKSHLDTAIIKATERELHDLLTGNYDLKTRIAEEEGDYKEALFSSRKKDFHFSQFNSRGADFDLKNYYLQLEAEQLIREKENQQLELNLANSQLRFSIILGLLLLSLTIFAIVAFWNQRKKKETLRLQNELISEQTKQLASLDKAKSRFFSNVSHELRTPLTLILGPINSVVKNGNLDEKNIRILKKAQNSGRDLLKLVASILDLSKIEEEKVELNEQAEFFYRLISRIVYAFESHAVSNNIHFSLEYASDKDLQLSIDKIKLETILNNFLSNAIKFTQANGKIGVTVKDNGTNIRISVSDTGRGIHPNDVPYVFDRYYQSRQPNATTEGGTGIGLALASELAKLMGGETWVESEWGQGTTFCLILPKKEVDVLKIDDNSQDFESPKNSTEIVHSRATLPIKEENTGNLPYILVVEDNFALRDYIKIVLEPYYKVLSAENGFKALEVLQMNPDCQLILSDIMMPEMDGFQLLSVLKSKDYYRHIPVVMLTARADVKDKLKALRIGVDDYMLKPFDEDELLVRIQNLLENQKIRKETIAVEGNGIEAKAATITTVVVSEKDKAWLERFEVYVEKHLDSNLLSVSSLANEFAMSESTLLRQLKRLTGLSPVKYLLEMRLDKARQLIESQSDLTIGQIASKVGYTDTRNFSRSFKKRYGKGPSVYLSTL